MAQTIKNARRFRDSMKALLFIIALLMLPQAVVAVEGHTTLLATEQPVMRGVSADLYLRIEPGTGSVFMETVPLTKVDTQISTRYAKEIACRYLNTNCDAYDFYYTIRAGTGIIGGPSAGAAMAALTVSLLEGASLNKSVAITGTINSGNVIGSVGGLPEKLEAASDAGIKKVLIPKGGRSATVNNQSIDLYQYGEALGVEVVEVFTLAEVMKEFTGNTFIIDSSPVSIDPQYSKIMESLAAQLCERTNSLSGTITAQYDVQEIAANLTRQGTDAWNAGQYYSAASFCFSANVRYSFLQAVNESVNPSSKIRETEREIEQFTLNLRTPETVSDAQALAVVVNRLDEATLRLNASTFHFSQNRTEDAYFELAFAVERLRSAEAWSQFFAMPAGRKISAQSLEFACTTKLAEAQERVEYLSILFEDTPNGAADKLQNAQKFYDDGNTVQCLHEATLAKAEANTLLAAITTRDEDAAQLVELKTTAALRTIAEQAETGIFPIVGYSYYEYANTLKDDDVFSALLFSEYALELSNLDIYFRETKKRSTNGNSIKTPELQWFAAGVLAGSLFTAAILIKAQTHKRKKRIFVKSRALKP
jgi:uncharacterized protein